VVLLLGLAACGAGGTPAAETAVPSSSAVPSPATSCEPYPGLVDDPLTRRSSLVRGRDVDTLVIAAGSQLCNGTGDAPLPLSMAYITFGPAGTRATPSGQHQLIGSYDGSQALHIPFPVLASPCLGAAVYLGVDDIGDKQLPSTPLTGVEDGSQLYRTYPAALLGKSDVTWGLLAVDAVGGKKCSSALRPAK
jgi:hypothetical protein